MKPQELENGCWFNIDNLTADQYCLVKEFIWYKLPEITPLGVKLSGS